MKIEIVNRWTKAVIISGEFESLKAAVAASDADLSGADLSGADLRGADLRDADLSGADLRGADLRDANLRGADLRDANLSGADLRGADLRDANLPEGFLIARLDLGGWPVTVLPNSTAIGCQTHPNEDWLKWTPDDVADFADGAKEYWERNREIIQAVIGEIQKRSAPCPKRERA